MKAQILLILAGTVMLGGCAWSAEGLGRAKVEDVYHSDKPASEVAGCVSSRLMGSNPAFQESDNHWVVLRNNGYGVPIVRWDIFPEPNDPDGKQTRIEFRRSVAMMSGEKKASTCF